MFNQIKSEIRSLFSLKYRQFFISIFCQKLDFFCPGLLNFFCCSFQSSIMNRKRNVLRKSCFPMIKKLFDIVRMWMIQQKLRKIGLFNCWKLILVVTAIWCLGPWGSGEMETIEKFIFKKVVHQVMTSHEQIQIIHREDYSWYVCNA